MDWYIGPEQVVAIIVFVAMAVASFLLDHAEMVHRLYRQFSTVRWPYPGLFIVLWLGLALTMASLAQNSHSVFLVNLGFALAYSLLLLAILWGINAWLHSEFVRGCRRLSKNMGTGGILFLFLFAVGTTALYHADKLQSLKPTTQILSPPATTGNVLPAALLFTPKIELSPLVVGEKQILTPYCENAGPLTAYDANQISNVTPIDVDDPSKPGYVSPSKTDYVYTRWSHPQGFGTSTIPKGPCTHIWLVGDPLTDTLKRELDQGSKVLVWVGLSRWRDEHGQFTYEQCYWRSTTGYWNICENHNGVKAYPETSDDTRTRVHDWIAGTSLSISDVSSEFPDAIFVDHIQLSANGASMLLWQPKQYSQYLVLQAGIGLADESRIRSFKSLSAKKRDDFLGDIVIEVNRMQLECAVQPTPKEMVTIRKTILISTLTNESLHSSIQSLNSAIALVEALIQKEFR